MLEWETNYQWVSSVPGNEYKANGPVCLRAPICPLGFLGLLFFHIEGGNSILIIRSVSTSLHLMGKIILVDSC